jgi:predicted ATPase/class 3 adenylate cyclase
MIHPPSGTVTFMFTDIQGSTKLWESYPDSMKLALDHHNELMAQIVKTHNGYLVKTTGDGMLAAFADPASSATAAVAVHQGLAAGSWEGVGSLKVRIGLHTGNAQYSDGDYYGSTLNRASRIMSIGHGGQTLVSVATQKLLADTLPTGLSLQDLGHHQLKDLTRPENVYQLNHPELDRDFAALKSLSRLPHNLSVQVTSFVGRDNDVEQITVLLDTARAVTLTGIGGAGKTRLSLQVAADLIEQYADGVWFVELARITEPSLVVNTIGEVLEISEVPGRAMLDTLSDALQRKQLLLVIDNCEHLLETGAEVAAVLLKACPELRILASSREELGIAGETTYAVAPLPLPDAQGDVGALLSTPSVQLFVERAQAAKPLFQLTKENAEAVSSICRRLDGLPLALELAATRLKIMPPQKLVERLEDRFRYLTGGKREALAHHQTLRATIDWSYDLLDEAEQLLLNRLSVFQNGFVIEAAEGVCAGEGLDGLEVLDYLSQLVQKSLVEVDEQGDEARYRLLETVRQYAEEKLEAAGETEKLHKAHLDYYLALAEIAEPELTEAEQLSWLQRLHKEHDNFRGALHWAMQADQWEEAQRIGGALGRFWGVHGHWSEGRAWLEQALQARDSVDLAAQAKALRWAGNLAAHQGEGDQARALQEEALALNRELGDAMGIAMALSNLANVARLEGDLAESWALREEALALHRELGNTKGIALNLRNQGLLALQQGYLAEARALQEESLALCRELGDARGIADALGDRGQLAIYQGDLAGARALYEESLALHRELDHMEGISGILVNMGQMALMENKLTEARQQLTQSLKLRQELGHKLPMIGGSALMATIFHKAGFAEIASQLQGASSRWGEEVKAPLELYSQEQHDETQAALKDELGEAAYLAAFVAGQQLSFEEMVELALREPDASDNSPE